MDYKPLFTCTPMSIKNGDVETMQVHMRVDVGSTKLCYFILKSGSMEEGNRLAALLTEVVEGILPNRGTH